MVLSAGVLLVDVTLLNTVLATLANAPQTDTELMVLPAVMTTDIALMEPVQHTMLSVGSTLLQVCFYHQTLTLCCTVYVIQVQF